MDDESDIPNIEDLEAKLADVTLIFEATVTVAAREWMDRIAKSHRTSRGMLLLSTEKSLLRVFSTYEEKGNFF